MGRCFRKKMVGRRPRPKNRGFSRGGAAGQGSDVQHLRQNHLHHPAGFSPGGAGLMERNGVIFARVGRKSG